MQVVLVHPQIPQNTGSIARTCAATRTPLHLIHPMGFTITEKAVRRAGLDYWPFVDLHHHENFESYVALCKPERLWFFETLGSRVYHSAPIGPNDALVFGSETKGLGREFLSRYPADHVLTIPMDCAEVRSLNLSNAVSIALFEARRQHGK